MGTIAIKNNTKNGQFEYRENDHLAFLTYREREKTMYFMLTKVPDELAGKGIASSLAKEALEYAKSRGFKIAVMCPFLSGYVKRHPEWYALYDTEYHKQFRSGDANS